MDAGAFAWVGLTLYVLGYDAWAILKKKRTLSAAFYAGARSKWGPVIIVGWLYLTAHLFGLLPDGWDPLEWLG